MRQAVFEARYGLDWNRFEQWLDHDERRRKRAPNAALEPAHALPDVDVPQAYRRICQHLALARDRQYSPELVDRLNRLALRGHHLLYGARARRGAARSLEFLVAGFPRLVRAERGFVIAAACLFFGPVLALIAALQAHPDFIYYLVDPVQLARFQEMYDPANKRLGMREADDNVAMFGFYIFNNVRIGFQTFAGGLVFGVGTILYLLYNGVFIGAITGHIIHSGLATPFFSFTSGHSAFELGAICLSGAAGLKLGYALVAPGLLRRSAALRKAAAEAVPLVVGLAGMLLLAAAIEAFWSPRTFLPPAVKYAIGGALWLLVVLYFSFAGRDRAA